MHHFIVNFARAVTADPILDIDDIGLIEKVVDHGRNEVKSSIKDQKTATWLFYPILVLPLVKLFEKGVQDAGKYVRKVTLALVLNIWVLHVDGADCKQSVCEFLDQSHDNIVLLNRRPILIVLDRSGCRLLLRL